jgi:2-oxoglutarate ferredoxin oxidoreductase subunit gamma
MAEPFKIIICGEGGQGALSIAEILAYASWLQGKQAVALPYFSTEKRGGVAMAYVQISDAPIVFPKFDKADLWVVLSQRSIDRIFSYLKEGTKTIVNSFLVKDVSAIADWKPYQINATEIAKVQLQKPRTFNMVILGAVVKLVPGMDRESFKQALAKHFKDKYERDPSLKELNEKAFNIGYDIIK